MPMKKVLDHYEVNKDTMALLSAAHIDYCTIVLETDRILYVKKTPTQIVKSACLEGFSTYDGRRKAVTYHIGAKQKVPIPIIPRDNIYAFPTHSPKDFKCNWIFYNHVKYIKTLNTPNQPSQSLIIFKNGQQITLNESHYILKNQMKRTAICILSLSAHPVADHRDGSRVPLLDF